MDQIGAVSLAALAAAQVADPGALTAPQVAEAADFSVTTMFLRATTVVQIVMILLVVASFWSWAIIIEKALGFRRLAALGREFEASFWSGNPLEDLYERVRRSPSAPLERVFLAGMGEWQRSFSGDGLIPGTLSRVDRAMTVATARESAAITARLPFLATVGSVSPFVGLFGTVWGIKHAFESIAMQQNTNLAVVAPGIAEALLATALGLLAAIPAVVAYNRLGSIAEELTGSLENFADEFTTILSREIERGGAR